jgi:uncharacterized membrane protein YuzA (DUF378 family)
MGAIKAVTSFVTNIAQFLVLVGALNWGLIGFNKTDAVVMIFPRQTVRFVHLAVGIAALYLILQRFL